MSTLNQAKVAMTVFF